jgi:hypothetical protein
VHPSAEQEPFEGELALAMTEYADRQPVPVYDPSAFTPQRGRHDGWALAASVTALAAIGAGLLWAFSGSPSTPVSPATHPPTAKPPTATARATPPPTKADPPQLTTLRALVTAALRDQAPATRPTVDLAAVRRLFPDSQTYQQVWGAHGDGVSCGANADGAVSADGTTVLFFHGSDQLPQQASFRFSADGTKLVGVRCAPAAARLSPHDLTLFSFLGAQVEAPPGGRVAMPCGQHTSTTWFAFDPGTESATQGWQITLDGTGESWFSLTPQGISGTCDS